MASYYTFENGFEGAPGLTTGGFTSQSDTQGKISIPHFSQIWNDSRVNVGPYRGAYCMKVDLSIGTKTTTAYYQEDTGFDAGATDTRYGRFYLYVSPNITMANNDEFHIVVGQSTGPVSEMVIGLNYTTANGLRLAVGQSGGTSFLSFSTGKWHCIEWKSVGAAGTGTIDYWLDGFPGAQVASLTNAAVVQARVGAQAQDAGTTNGVLLIDELVVHSGRVFPISQRFATSVTLTSLKNQLFVGPGMLVNLTLLPGNGTDCIARVYDTDTGAANDMSSVVAEVNSVTALSGVDLAGVPILLNRGCYILLSGTTPRAVASIGWAPSYGSDGAIRTFGANRRTAVNENV